MVSIFRGGIVLQSRGFLAVFVSTFCIINLYMQYPPRGSFAEGKTKKTELFLFCVLHYFLGDFQVFKRVYV